MQQTLCISARKEDYSSLRKKNQSFDSALEQVPVVVFLHFLLLSFYSWEERRSTKYGNGRLLSLHDTKQSGLYPQRKENQSGVLL